MLNMVGSGVCVDLCSFFLPLLFHVSYVLPSDVLGSCYPDAFSNSFVLIPSSIDKTFQICRSRNGVWLCVVQIEYGVAQRCSTLGERGKDIEESER